ncbi:MAG: hypothetical protein M5R36_08110 [Deltaproteobacteria bacterium]|nr:hypothetical protein [Deltaproteobacteria bacterium]
MTSPSPGSVLAERDEKRRAKAAEELCAMGLELRRLKEKIENMKRQPSYMRGAQDRRLTNAEDMRDRLQEAIERGRESYRHLAGRAFDTARDCKAE